MTTPGSQIDVCAHARAAVEALGDLQGYLSAAVNPDRIALGHLKVEEMGWTKHAYCDKAFEIWRRQLDLFPDDPLILHHMAIMHHARAFDLEAGPKPSQADADWTAAMGYWHRLHGMDSFWEQLGQKAFKGAARPELIHEVRARFPQLILAIHFDIALDPETLDKRKSRAKWHLALALGSPFDARERAEARRAAYNRYIASAPAAVWQPGELREEVLAKGQEAIVTYLKFDPECIPALEDALRIQRRIQRSRNTAWAALDPADPRRKELLLREKRDAESWINYFDRLAEMSDDLEDDVREELSHWYHGRGWDLCAMDMEEKAVAFFRRALSLLREEDHCRGTCRRSLVRTLAYVARQKAGEEKPDAELYCDQVRARDDLSPLACFLLAQAYLQLGMHDDAAEVCERGVEIEPDFDDLEGDEWIERLGKLRAELPVTRLVRRGADAIKEDRNEEALEALDEAAALVSDAGSEAAHNTIPWLRAHAHLALGHIIEARRDLEFYKGLLGRDASASDRDAGKRLEKMVAQAEALFAEFGGPEAAQLRQQAVQAFNADRHEQAIRCLREAIEKAGACGHPGGTPKLRSELSMVLANSAIGRANSAQEEATAQLDPLRGVSGRFSLGASFPPSPQQVLRNMLGELAKAERMLAEAVQLDRGNAKASAALRQIRELIASLRDKLP